MQRDPSGMDQNRDRPSSPAPGDNVPSPSKRPRIDGAPFNSTQPGGMVPNGRPAQGLQGQQMANNANTTAQQMLVAHGINPHSLTTQQLTNFMNSPHGAQQKSIATYSQNLQHHHGSQMGNKQGPNAGGPPNQGSPMIPQGPDSNALNAYYNPETQMPGPGGMRPGPGGAPQAAGSNHALQDYQMQLMLLEQQNKKRLMMARQEQDTITGLPREGGGPGGPGQPGPNASTFPEASPQAMRSGASPNPADQMKRGTPQMNNSGIPSPVPEGGQSRDSPNPAMNFMGNQVDPSMAPHFFKPGGVDGNMAAQAQINGMRPPSSHPGQPYNGQMNPQQQMMARQMQQGQGQGAQQPGNQGQPGQWQQGPNGQTPQGMQPNQQVQGTPQQRSMPPPSAPAATTNSVNSRTTASPQQAAAAPPTPSQSSKAAPKKKETKAAKEKVSSPSAAWKICFLSQSPALSPLLHERVLKSLANIAVSSAPRLLRKLIRLPTIPELPRRVRTRVIQRQRPQHPSLRSPQPSARARKLVPEATRRPPLDPTQPPRRLPRKLLKQPPCPLKLMEIRVRTD